MKEQLKKNQRTKNTSKMSQDAALLIGVYYIHFEITGYPCNLIGSQRCDLFLNCTIFCSKSYLFQIASFMF